jgi:hypothetical protein
MRLLAAFAFAILPVAAGAAPPHDAAPSSSRLALHFDTCSKPTSHYAVKPGEPLKPRKLTDLPPGNMYVAVYRRDTDGCENPIVVKYGVGRR